MTGLLSILNAIAILQRRRVIDIRAPLDTLSAHRDLRRLGDFVGWPATRLADTVTGRPSPVTTELSPSSNSAPRSTQSAAVSSIRQFVGDESGGEGRVVGMNVAGVDPVCVIPIPL